MSSTSTFSFLFTNVCSQAIIPTIKSTAGWFWYFITLLWPWYWVLIVAGLILWTVFEIATRNSDWHYNSDNGFSPLFNSVVGSGTYLFFQTITHFVLEKIFGYVIYCNPFSYFIHIIVFIATGGFLYGTGFWVYWRFLGQRPRPRKKNGTRARW